MKLVVTGYLHYKAQAILKIHYIKFNSRKHDRYKPQIRGYETPMNDTNTTLCGFQLSIEGNFAFALHGFALLRSGCDWLTKFAPLSQPTRSKPKTNRASLARFFRAWHRLHEFASSSDWSFVLFSFLYYWSE